MRKVVFVQGGGVGHDQEASVRQILKAVGADIEFEAIPAGRAAVEFGREPLSEALFAIALGCHRARVHGRAGKSSRHRGASASRAGARLRSSAPSNAPAPQPLLRPWRAPHPLQSVCVSPAPVGRVGRMKGCLPWFRPTLYRLGRAAQTVAPTLGSLGSPSFLTGPLSRSSRLMPSHMAMAAATNTEE